jgi:hypothetical protein
LIANSPPPPSRQLLSGIRVVLFRKELNDLER